MSTRKRNVGDLIGLGGYPSKKPSSNWEFQMKPRITDRIPKSPSGNGTRLKWNAWGPMSNTLSTASWQTAAVADVSGFIALQSEAVVEFRNIRIQRTLMNLPDETKRGRPKMFAGLFLSEPPVFPSGQFIRCIRPISTPSIRPIRTDVKKFPPNPSRTPDSRKTSAVDIEMEIVINIRDGDFEPLLEQSFGVDLASVENARKFHEHVLAPHRFSERSGFEHVPSPRVRRTVYNNK